MLVGSAALANHITGGEMYYVWKGQSGSDHIYEVTLKLFRDCNAPSGSAPLDPTVIIAVYDKGNNSIARQLTVSQTKFETLKLNDHDPCISNPPIVCYEVGYYTFTITLPPSASGYTITYQRCCRITAINNITPNSNQYGATYSAEIPGTASGATGPANTSAKFTGNDLVVICANNYFCYDFGATDADNDGLRYSLCSAFVGGSQGNAVPNPPSPPPYSSVPYASPFNGAAPLGAAVTINPQTGMICGTAPGPGIYVVTVCVEEVRNGVVIATQRKDLQIKIGDCNVAQAVPAVFDEAGFRVSPEAAGCRSFTYSFSNDVPPNPLIRTFYWEFSDGATYTVPNPKHTFADTGIYTVKLVINRGDQCGDSAVTQLKVYPGFNPGFTFNGICAGKPTRFTDVTTTTYGSVNSWRWNFGDPNATDDTSRLKNPVYTYPQENKFNLEFIVTSNLGCIDTVRKQIDILTKPPLQLPFKDTLICNGDSLQLSAIGQGVFTWTPGTRIFNANTDRPTVYPTVTTNYFVQLDDQGCIANDTVQVRVVNFVTLQAMPDTTICAGDNLLLSAATDGLQYLWSPAGGMNDATLLQPTVRPTATTTYTIRSTIGKCSATDNVTVRLVPYPAVDVGPDTIICYNTAAFLNGRHDGSSFAWSPTATLMDANTLNPVAWPKGTTSYVLTSFDTRGCPKPGRDTVVVVVNPEIHAFAGSDTAVVAGQSLQFNATGGESYTWSPPTALSNASTANPIGLYDGSFDSIRYVVTVRDAIGCSDEATVTVKIYKTAPRVFVPNAFTPNGDGRNDVLRPIAVGLTKMHYFRVYNRWGQLVFETTQNGRGWDGKIKGLPQGSETFAWIVSGEDFTGKKVFEKGTVTLIR
jgi:gliding motility-associated-like protein